MTNGQPLPRNAQTHALKIWPENFDAIIDGRKRFEIQPTEHSFEVGDMLRLMEWDPLFSAFTGAWALAQVTHLVLGGSGGVQPGFCVMSITPMLVNWRNDQRLMDASRP